MPNTTETLSTSQTKTDSSGLDARWAANMMVKIPLTSFAISVITTPLTSLLTAMQVQQPTIGVAGRAGGAFFGSMSMAMLYKGLIANIISGQKRGAVVMTAKSTSQTEIAELSVDGAEIKPSARANRMMQYSLPVVFAQADLAISQISANIGKLQQSGLIHKDSAYKLTGHNAIQLFKMGYAPRSISGATHFLSMCFLSTYLSKHLPFKSELADNLLGGALSGAFAAVATHIPNSIADHMVISTKMSPDGKLSRMTTPMFFKSMERYVRDAGPKEASLYFMRRSMTQLPIRVIQTTAIFATIQVADYIMGEDPLAIFDPEDSSRPEAPRL